jgi:hypothetical protein
MGARMPMSVHASKESGQNERKGIDAGNEGIKNEEKKILVITNAYAKGSKLAEVENL